MGVVAQVCRSCLRRKPSLPVPLCPVLVLSKRSSLTEDYLWRDSRGGAYGSEVMCRDVYGLGVAPRWQRIRVRVRVALRYWRATPRFGFGSRSGDWINGLLFSRIMIRRVQPNLNAQIAESYILPFVFWRGPHEHGHGHGHGHRPTWACP